MKQGLLLNSILWVLLFSCKSEPSPTNQIEFLASYEIDVTEPSGLAINTAGNILYTVSDNSNKVYKLSMKGDLLQSFEYVGNDLEGICNFKNGAFLLADERLKNLVEYYPNSGLNITHHIDYENEGENSGIEGVTYDPKTQSIYFLNEKNPGELFKLDNSFNIKKSYELDFADDYSGIFCESEADLLWIVSDKSQSINKCDLKGNLISSYIINVNKPEGIVVTDDKIYVVSDADDKLYVYQKPQ